MASTDRQTPDPLVSRFAREIHERDFFQLMRRLQAHWRDWPRHGTSSTPDRDPIRLAQRPSLAFAPSSMEALEEGDIPRLYVNFFGLFGPNGPLPFHLTEFARLRAMGRTDPTADEVSRMSGRPAAGAGSRLPSGRRDTTLCDFLDLFHHRLISLFFRAWACHQQTVDFDRAEDQRFPFYVGSFFGLANESDSDGIFSSFPDDLPRDARLYHGGRLACPTRNREGLEAILQDYFQLPTEVHPFLGRWFDLPATSRCQLGCSPETGVLGQTAIIGTRTWQRQLTFRIRFGPMKRSDLRRMLPGGDSYRRLSRWVLHYIGCQYHVQVQLVVQADEVPDIRLGQQGRLSRDAWLRSQRLGRDAEDALFDLDPDRDLSSTPDSSPDSTRAGNR
jgi:type VI secretion system protein ImpH